MDIGEVVKNGFNRTLQRTGLILVAVYAVINLLTSIFTFDVTSLVPKSQLPFGSGTSSGFGPGATQVATTPGFSIELSLPLLLAINVVGWIVGLAFTVVATRVLVSDHTDSIPEAFYKERMVSAVGNIILAGFTVALIFVGSALVFTEVPSYISSTFAILGFLAWIVFAVVLLVSFVFINIYIAVEDRSFVDAITSSWELSSGNRLNILLVLLVVGIVNFLIGLVVGAVSGVFVSALPIIYNVVIAAVGGFSTVFSVAVMAQVYNSLKGGATF